MKPIILFKVEGTPYRRALAADFTVHDLPPPHAIGADPVVPNARILVTSGFAGLSRQELAALPGLELVCCLGTGYERVDVAAARERGITVTHGAGTNAGAVADHAMAMLLAVMRDLPRLDAAVRRGEWRAAAAPRPIPTGKRLGLVGLGGIGLRVARRAEAFEMPVAYHTRTPRADVPWRHVPDMVALARDSDCLVLAAPGGAATFHMVDAAVLAALGPDGFLVNVGRGSLVDTAALVAALRAGTIAGAALDVFEDEPDVPQALREAPNALLTPHVAGWAPEARTAAITLLRDNIARFLAGKPVLTPIPEMRPGE